MIQKAGMIVSYAGPFILLVLVPILYYALSAEATIAAVGTLLALLLATELAAPKGMNPAQSSDWAIYRFVPVLYIPLQLAVLSWAIALAGRSNLTVSGFVALALSVGVLMGVFGMLSAHEMVHSPIAWQRRLGTLLLTGMLYRHFRIAHIYGHHRWAATERDSATARLSEGFYAYLVRTLPQQFLEAFHFEKRRCAIRHMGIFSSRVSLDFAIYTGVGGTIFLLTGWRGLSFYTAESLIAITVLELFNYIAHYGLVRERARDGGFEPAADHYSWNSSNVLANALILNMGRHSDHHRRPQIPYQRLLPVSQAPELPLGYAGSILLAFFPPLWRRVMDPKVRHMRALSYD
jgi:alkane 1-monooxygenase